MKIDDCRFDRATVKAEDEPRPLGGDVVFLGRSNVGKSSLINGLLGVKGLARTSSTPGRTQTVNFYRVNRAHFFVDLPGYGFAKVPVAMRQHWGELIQTYFEGRQSLNGVVLIIDARRGLTDQDRQLIDWIETAGNYVRLHAGKTAHLLRETLSSLETRLDRDRFLRVHRTTILNVERLRELQPWFSGEFIAILHDGTRLKVSRGYRGRVADWLGQTL